MDLLEDVYGVPEDPLLEVHGDLSLLYDVVCVLKEDLLLGEYALPSGVFHSLENFFP